MSKDPLNEPDVRRSHRLAFRVFAALLAFVVLVIAGTFFAIDTVARRTLEEQAERLNLEVGQNILLRLSERLAVAEALAKGLARLAEGLPADETVFRQAVRPLLEPEEEMDPDARLIAGGGIWPEPYAFDPEVERRSFFWSRNARGELLYFDDYNDSAGAGYHEEEWYVPARYLQHGKVYWSKSYMDPYSYVPMVTCTVPYWKEGKFAGVATVDLRLEGISEFMAEQAKRLEGYAFALDRNNRLISFPDISLGARVEFDSDGNEIVEYLEIDQVAPQNAFFAELTKRIEDYDTSLRNTAKGGVEAEGHLKLAERIAEDSYQIEFEEALKIARSIWGREDQSLTEQFRLSDDVFLEQESLLSVFAVPYTDWRVVVAMPTAYSDGEVAGVARSVAKIVLVAVVLVCLLLYAYLWKSVFAPVTALRGEVRKLALQRDREERLSLEGNDELGQIAYWFNQRTDQLREAMENLRLSNRELEDAKLAAETASRTKNVFLASMSHEIRTPMNAIIGLSALLSEMQMGREQAGFVQTIRSSAESLLTLINDILDYTKIEANELDLEEVAFDLRDLLEELTAMVCLQAEEKGLGFSCYLAVDSPGSVLGDPGRLKQVLLNLASNAIKFTISGRVDIYGQSIESTDTEIIYRFSVKDTGIGIPEEAFPNLFDSFQQVDSSTTRKFGGTGLGLAISKRLCEGMGGSISVESKVGIGSEFAFTVTLRKGQSSRQSTRRAESRFPLLTAFVLDSDWPHDTILKEELLRLGLVARVYRDIESLDSDLSETPGIKVVFAGRVHGMSHSNVLERVHEASLRHFCSVVSFASTNNYLALGLDVKQRLKANLEKPFSRARLVEILSDVADTPVVSPLPGEAEPTSSSDDLFVGYLALLVEDNPVNQKVTTQILKTLGVHCQVASDGVEAIEMVRRSPKLDVILMDWQMPVMDGLDATREIRALEDWRAEIPIVAMTANAMRGDREKCLSAGMNDYLPKPVLPTELVSVLKRVLS